MDPAQLHFHVSPQGTAGLLYVNSQRGPGGAGAWLLPQAPTHGEKGTLCALEGSISLYCQEWEIDQLLQFCRHNFIFLIFAWFFKAKYSTKICPS